MVTMTTIKHSHQLSTTLQQQQLLVLQINCYHRQLKRKRQLQLKQQQKFLSKFRKFVAVCVFTLVKRTFGWLINLFEVGSQKEKIMVDVTTAFSLLDIFDVYIFR